MRVGINVPELALDLLPLAVGKALLKADDIRLMAMQVGDERFDRLLPLGSPVTGRRDQEPHVLLQNSKRSDANACVLVVVLA